MPWACPFHSHAACRRRRFRDAPGHPLRLATPSRPPAACLLHPPAEDQGQQYTADWVGEYPAEKLRLPQGSRPVAAAAVPNLAAWPWYNHGLSVEARVDALLKAMTTQEKVLQLQTEPVQAVPRLGVTGEQRSSTRVGGSAAPLVSQPQRWYSLGARPDGWRGRCADWPPLLCLSTSAQHCATAVEPPALLPLPLPNPCAAFGWWTECLHVSAAVLAWPGARLPAVAACPACWPEACVKVCDKNSTRPPTLPLCHITLECACRDCEPAAPAMCRQTRASTIPWQVHALGRWHYREAAAVLLCARGSAMPLEWGHAPTTEVAASRRSEAALSIPTAALTHPTAPLPLAAEHRLGGRL